MRSFAQIISIFFSPLTFIPLMVFFKFQQMHFSPAQWYLTGGIIVMLGIVPIVTTLAVFKYVGLISDWGIANRRQRHLFGAIAIAWGGITTWVLFQLQFSELGLFLLWLVGGNIIFSAITLFWKISAHTAAVTLFSLFTIYVYGALWLSLLLIIFTVASNSLPVFS